MVRLIWQNNSNITHNPPYMHTVMLYNMTLMLIKYDQQYSSSVLPTAQQKNPTKQMQPSQQNPTDANPHHHHHHHHASQPSKQKPYRHGLIRFFTLFLLAMVVFGNQYAFNNPQALQDSIMTELDINQPQYDMLYTIFALPNIFATFIIGFLIDFLGVRIGLVTLSFGVVIFQAVVAFGGAYKSYATMLVGRMLFGIASESLITAQASFVSFWFVGKELAFALGLAITIPELGNALNSFLTPIIYQNTKSLGPPLFTSVGVCSISFLCAVAAAYIDKKADLADQQQNLKIVDPEAAEGQSQQIKCEDLKMLKGSFWLIVTLCMFAVALYVTFLDNANKLLQVRFCYTQTSAGQAIMITYIVAACCSAPLGLLVDKIGHKRYFTIACMVIFTCAQLIILVYPQCLEGQITDSFSGASWGLFLLGVGYCFYANCIVPSIPLVVRKKVTGTAFGIMQMIESIALAFFPLIAAVLVSHGKNQQIGYRHSSLFFFVIGLLGIATSLGLLFVSNKTKRKLDASSAERQVKKQRLHSEDTSQSETENENKIEITNINSQSQIKQSLLQHRQSNPLIDPALKRTIQMEL